MSPAFRTWIDEVANPSPSPNPNADPNPNPSPYLNPHPNPNPNQVAPLWRMGKRKKPPKLPQAAVGGMRMMYR